MPLMLPLLLLLLYVAEGAVADLFTSAHMSSMALCRSSIHGGMGYPPRADYADVSTPPNTFMEIEKHIVAAPHLPHHTFSILQDKSMRA